MDAFPGHSPIESVINTALNIFSLNIELFGWSIGSLLLLTLLSVSGTISRKDIWALLVIASVIGVHCFFWYHGGPDFGARYWFLSIIPFIALTVRGAEWVSRSTSGVGIRTSSSDGRVMVAVAAMCLVTLISYLPWRVSDKYYRYLRMQPGIEQLAKDHGFGRSLVIVRGKEHPDYQSTWVYNPVDFEGDVPVYAFDRNSEVYEELLRKYVDRPIWIVHGPTLTGGQYSIVRGPVDANELLNELN